MENSKPMRSDKPQRAAFNLQLFYQDLRRVQSSLEKKQAGSSLPKKLTRNERNDHGNLAAFKREITKKQLTKTKIQLNVPYERNKISTNVNKDKLDESEQYRFSELSHELDENDTYQQVRQKLLSWKRDQVDERSQDETQLLHSQIPQKRNTEAFQRTAESHTRTNQQTINHSMITPLLQELTKRNALFKQAEKIVGVEKSYFRKRNETDLSLRLEQHFRQHTIMRQVIEEFQRICGLKMQDLNELAGFLQQGGSRISAYGEENEQNMLG